MKRKGDWIQTYTGKQFWPLDPRPEDVCIEDIAHALGNICRYNGHCHHFYSVAEHCVHISYNTPTFHLRMVGLLHDAAEAYVTDVPKPLKPYLTGYKKLEMDVLAVIFKGLNLEDYFPLLKYIKKIDAAILADEASQVMGKPPADWNLPFPSLGVEIEYWNPKTATKRFLDRYIKLTQ